MPCGWSDSAIIISILRVANRGSHGEPGGRIAWRGSRARLRRLAQGSVSRTGVTADAGLLARRELDSAAGLTTMAADMLAGAHTGRKGGHALAGLRLQSVFGRLAGYEDVNDAKRPRHDSSVVPVQPVRHLEPGMPFTVPAPSRKPPPAKGSRREWGKTKRRFPI